MYSKLLIVTVLALTALLTQTPPTNGAKILAVYSLAGRSHFQMHRAIIKALVDRGHEVTMITAETLKPMKLGNNYTEILIEPEFDFWKLIHETIGTSSAFDFTEDPSKLLKVNEVIGIGSTEHTLKQPKIQAVINAKQTKGVYDLLLVEQLMQEAFLALAHVYDIPVISTATFAQQSYMSEMFGLISPLSYVPLNYMPFTDRMTFWERVQNTYYTLSLDIKKELSYFPKMDALVKKYFGHLAIDFPSTSAMNRNLSATLINNYAPLALPSPKMDNMINVGGIHIYPNKSLPANLQKFLDEAKHGAIYFSLGTHVTANDLPPEKIQIFLDVFRNLKQRVLWKFENVSLANVPDNVMIKTWMPQNDILAHPNVRAFISHGGMFGTQEAIYHGVPVVGIPFFADQFINIMRGERMGYSIALNIRTLTREGLKSTLHKVLYEAKYRDNTKRMSQVFRDRTMGPRETAVYWIEYVIRHRGARHMRAAGLDLKWYQFYLLDVFAFYAATVTVPLAFSLLLIWWIWRRFKGVERKHKYSKILVGTVLALAALLTKTPTTDGAKILAVYTFPGRSHYQMHNVIIKELVKHGHEVTMVTAQTLKPLNLGKNYTEILIEPEFDYWTKVYETTGTNSAYDLTNALTTLIAALTYYIAVTTEHALKQPNVQAIINAKETKGVYDLLLVEQLREDAFLALTHIYNIPVISTATFAQQTYMSEMFGLITPWSYVPFNFMPFSDRMDFWQRVQNTYYCFTMDLRRETNYYRQQDALVKKYFGHLAIDFPSTSAMSRNLSAILINNFTPLELPGPKMDNMISVGGMHIYPNKSLPADIQKILDEAEHGAIYFSLGTHVQAQDLPQDRIQVFLEAFRNIKQRVLWKFESDSLANVPDNVIIKAWMPQNDILAHPNVRAFISHGGMFGTQEAVYHGVPIIGIPFFSDQFINIKKGERMGYTIPLNIRTLTREDLTNAIHNILHDPKYRDTMQRMSKMFRDRPMGPRETAVYWIEYVIRHKGARHLRAAGLDLKWYQFYLLDVIAFYIAAAVLPLAFIVVLLRWTCRLFTNAEAKQKVQ